MAKIVFPGITIFPANGTLGVSTSTRPRVTIPHIVGSADGIIPAGKIAKPQLLGDLGFSGTGVGNLVDSVGVSRVWRFREAVDISGNNVPTTRNIPCTIIDVTNRSIYPPLLETTLQFVPSEALSSSKFYELEVEEELEYVIENIPAGAGGSVDGGLGS